MIRIIGRENEVREIKKRYESPFSELMVIYGRKGLGKTFIVNTLFNNKIFFKATGVMRDNTKSQIKNFIEPLSPTSDCIDWIDAFRLLKEKIINADENTRKVIFIDEISLFSKRMSNFIGVFSHFWNHFCTKRNDILLIISGSGIPWIINNILHNAGSLYNRVTSSIYMKPFLLGEVEEYLKYIDIDLSRIEIAELYMTFGGVPAYYNYLDKNVSVAQNIDKLFFYLDGELKGEYDLLFKSQFDSYEKYTSILEVISGKSKGLSRKEILIGLKTKSGGYLSEVLNNLKLSGILRVYSSKENGRRVNVYQIADHFCLFYTKHLLNKKTDDYYWWINNYDSPFVNSWREYSYKILCLNHLEQIKSKLGIAGISTSVYTWGNSNCQIDLVISRSDKVLDLIEIKYSKDPYQVSEDLYKDLENRKSQIRQSLKVTRSIHTVLITTFPIVENKYTFSVNFQVTLDNLFKIINLL